MSSAGKRKRYCPVRLEEVERTRLTWDCFTDRLHVNNSDATISAPPASTQRKKKRFTPTGTSSARPILPIILSSSMNEKDRLFLGCFKLAVKSATTSFPLNDSLESTTGSDQALEKLQTVEIIVGDTSSSVSLIVKEAVAKPFCCCYSLECDEDSATGVAYLASLAKTGLVTVKITQDGLDNLFNASRSIFSTGSPLRSPLLLTFCVEILLSYVSSNTALFGDANFRISGTFSRNLTAVVAWLNPLSRPPHMLPREDPDGDVYLPTFKRIQLFYASVKELQRRNGHIENLEIHQMNELLPGLASWLRCYQLRAVGWMLSREGVMQWPSQAKEESPLHPSWTRITPSMETGDVGRAFFMNFYTGNITFEEFVSSPLPKGGVLADEMGLGKTVEILALVVLHRKEGVYRKFVSAYEDILRSHNLVPFLSESEPRGGIDESPESDVLMVDACDEEKAEQDQHCMPPESAQPGDIRIQLPAEDPTSAISPNTWHSNQGMQTAVSTNLTSQFDAGHTDVRGVISEDGQNVPDQPTIKTLVSSPLRASENGLYQDSSKIVSSVRSPGSPSDSCTALNNDPPVSVVDVPASTELRLLAPLPLTNSSKQVTGIVGDLDVSQSNGLSSSAVAMPVENGDMMCSVNSSPGTPNDLQTRGYSSRGEDSPGTSGKRNVATVSPGNSSLLSAAVVSNSPSQFAQSRPLGVTDGDTNSSSQYLASNCNEISCLCGDSMETVGKQYIQCEECYKWQHVKCVGFNQAVCSEYRCIFCIGKQPIEAKTTLIVSPSPIAKQWLNEIKKHTSPGTIKAVFYEGVQGMIHPYVLAHFDVVITTYDVLRKELYNATTDGSRKKLRHQKKYKIIPSPLMTLKWWRLCVDEAQMVESEHSRAAEMCIHIQAKNKWFVTGTPIQREISDLYGLLVLLGVEPYNTKYWWKNLLWQPYLNYNLRPIADVFAKLMWRNNKMEVAGELGIPEQKESIEWLQFSPVEDHFYKKQQETCKGEALKVLDHFDFREDVSLANVQDYAARPLLAPLLKLRQACMHPHVVRGGIVSMKSTSMTMGELLVQLIRKSKNESQESLRQLVGALNGLAGIYRIQEKWSDAVECYRTAMSTWRDLAGELECDYTQRIHTLEALEELLRMGSCPNSRALADESLMEQAADLRGKFLQKKKTFVITSLEGLDAVTSDYLDLEVALNQCEGGINWFVLLLDKADREGFAAQLLSTVHQDLLHRIPAWCNNIWRFAKASDIVAWASSKWILLHPARGEALCSVRGGCTGPPRDGDVAEASSCHLRVSDPLNSVSAPATRRDSKCYICRIEEAVNKYELALFSSYPNRYPDERGAQNSSSRGSRVDSALEIVLKSMLGVARHRATCRDLVEAGMIHLNMFEEMKKEFNFMRTAWQAASEWVQGYDELNLASERFRLFIPGETLAEARQLNVLYPHEVDLKRHSLLVEKIYWESELRKNMGQCFYLQSLEKAKEIQGDNPENCPICIQPLGSKWCVLPCGHCLCVACCEAMRKTVSSPRLSTALCRDQIRCPFCRASAMFCEVSLVTTSVQGENRSRANVKGDHSTKIEAVIAKIMKIHEFEPNSKILIFSQWSSALELLAIGLKQNHIAYEYPYEKSSNNLQKSLTVFKTLPRLNVLLLPIHVGSNGLNLTEATHVMLCEPSLNPAAELQAVSRIHRMGQTRPTTVHRFYVKGTVEEKMYGLFHPDGEEGMGSERLESLDSSERKAELSIKEFRSLFGDTL